MTTEIKTNMLHLRVDKNLHRDVKKIAKNMGISLSLITETLLKNFLQEKRLIINDFYTPNKNLELILEEAKKNRDNSKYWKSHNSVESLMKDLKK